MSSQPDEVPKVSKVPKKMKTTTKPPPEVKKSQEEKKMTTKEMIIQALLELRSRKGTSLYAIKKYIEDKYKVDVEKMNYVIKKSIKTGVETGAIVQTKGVGASGSFKLPPKKDRQEKKQKPKKSVEKPTKSEKSEKPKKPESKDHKIKNKEVPSSSEKKIKSKKPSEPDLKEVKMKKLKATKTTAQTPAKKRAAMMKRKSIGSIIKPPKMKPKKG